MLCRHSRESGNPEKGPRFRGTTRIAAAFNRNAPAAYDSWLFTKAEVYRDPNNIPNLKALQINLEMQKTAGFVKIDIDVEKFADTSIVEEAAKRVNAR